MTPLRTAVRSATDRLAQAGVDSPEHDARALAVEEQAAKDSAARGSQIRTMDRSEKVRTYNFPDNRVADHRSGYKANNLGAVLDGDLDPVIQ